VFELQGTRVLGEFKVKLDGNKINRYSRVGAYRCGHVEGDKLFGEFRTEGMRGTWEAKNK